MHRASLSLLPMLLAGLPVPVRAQIRASERGSISQVIDGTVVTIDYARPRARGRDSLFGKVVKWGEVWTPGANFATTLELNRDAKLDGQAVPKGKYSVWMVVRRSGDWTVVLDPEFHRYHEYPPDSSAQQIRFPVRPATAPFAEQLTWTIPEARVSSADILMHWGTTLVTLKLEVQPSYQLTMSAADAAPYLGRYRFTWQREERPATPLSLVLSYQRGMLMASFEPADEYWDNMAMVRIAQDWFVAALFDHGQVYEVVREWVFEFGRSNGRVDSVTLRNQDDRPAGSGRRIPE